MSVNLILAVFWLVLALGLFIYSAFNPDAARVDFLNSGISIAWVALFLSAYNVLRWWLVRGQRREEDRLRRAQKQSQPREKEANSDFDFE
jgi:hypothetical protein